MHADHSHGFVRAAAYRALEMPPATGIRETAPEAAFPWSERHLRCVWADERWRPALLTTTEGQTVSVESPGRWNLEAGPDFLDALLHVGPGNRVLRGDIELHIRPADWRRHGHGGDRRYASVVAHVTWFHGRLPEGELPPGTLEIGLKEPLARNPLFSFEALDPWAYPYACIDEHPPCAVALKCWPMDAIEHLLDAAGEERLRLKTARMTALCAETSPAQALYEELMSALGYKQNRIPFRLLARRVPLDTLRQEAGGQPLKAYALLAGVAGLLPTRGSPAWDPETRAFVREAWDLWWKCQSAWEDRRLQRQDWTLSNLRPQNHPLRRLMAAAVLFAGPTPFLTDDPAPASTPSALMRRLQQAGLDSYWAHRHSLSGPRLAAPLALIGPGRAAAMVTNAILPWLSATGRYGTGTLPWLADLPAEDDNRFVRHTAHALFGHDHNPALYRTGLRQQGLLQIFNDYCLGSRNGCGGCTLPAALRRRDHQNS